MAKTIAKAFGEDTNRKKQTHRLGSKSATAQANTWKTFSTTHVNADGSGYFELRRRGELIHMWEWDAE